MEESPSVNQEYHSPFSAENQQEQRLGYIKQNSDDQNEALRSSHRRKYSRLSSSSSLSSSPSKNRKRSHSHTKKHRSRERERQTQDSSATTAASTRNGPRFQTFPKPPNFNEAQGDWRCQDCGNWNFAKRTHCNSCKIEKPRKTTNSRERSSRYYNDRDDKNYSSSNRSTNNRDSQYDRYSDKTSDYDRRQQYTRQNGGSSRSYNDRDRSYERRNSRERSRSNDRYNNSRSIRDDRNTHRGFSSQQEGSLRNNGDSNSNNITHHEGGRQYQHSSRFSNQPPAQSADEYKGKSHDSSYNTNGNNTQQGQTSTAGYDQDRREDKGLRDTNHRYQRDDRDNRRDDFSRSDRREERYNDDNRYSRDDKGGRDNKYDSNSRYRDRDDYNNNSSRDNNNRYSSDMPVRKQFQKKEGDWECVHCKNINYARRNECNRCRKPKE